MDKRLKQKILRWTLDDKRHHEMEIEDKYIEDENYTISVRIWGKGSVRINSFQHSAIK